MSPKTKKEMAQEFLKLTAKGDSREAFRQFVGNGFKHHNAFFKGDGETLMLAMEQNAAHFPDMVLDIQRALEDGDLVAVHSHVRMNPGELGLSLMHIFRFEGDKIMELWDFGQAVPIDMVNENGMF